jgi:hypothetical protein
MERRNKMRIEGGKWLSPAGFTAILALVFMFPILAGGLPQAVAGPCSWINTTVTFPMTLPRYHATSTLLPNGKVLIAGGADLSSSPATTYNDAYLYDPSTKTYTQTGYMNSPRALHTATLLSNGKVLIAGGWIDETGTNLDSAEIYDPATGVFQVLQHIVMTEGGPMTFNLPMNKTRSQHTATLLNDGTVLIAGGYGNGPDTAEIFNTNFGIAPYSPYTDYWIYTNDFSLNHHNMETQRNTHAATLLKDGRVLISGGANVPTFTIYDPSTLLFSSELSLGTTRTAHTATLLTDGKVLIAGGDNFDFDAPPLSSAILIDPSTSTVTSTGSLANARQWHTATLLPDNRVLIAGGNSDNSVEWFRSHLISMASAEIYNPTNGTFTRIEDMNNTHSAGNALMLPDQSVLVANGNETGNSDYIPLFSYLDSNGNGICDAGEGGSPTTYTLIYTPLPGGTVNGSVTPLSFSPVYSGQSGPSIKAIPFPGYYFTKWTPGDLTENPRIDNNITNNVDVKANFAIIDSNTPLLTKADPSGGTYNTTQYVNFAQVGSQTGTIYYTTDLSDPKTSSTRSQYGNNSIEIKNLITTLKFAATPDGGINWEPVKTEVYIINPAIPGSLALTSTDSDPYPAGNIPITVTFPAISNTIKPDCFSNTHFELYPCDLTSFQCDPLPSLCRVRQAYGPGDVGDIAAGDKLVCSLGDMYDPSVLNQLVPGTYTVKATYSNYIPIHPNLDQTERPKALWTGAIEFISEPISLSLYKFTGFLPPVDNLPVWNVAKSGQTIPVKWKVQDETGSGNAGMVASIKAKPILCPGSDVTGDDIEIYDPQAQTSFLQCYSDGNCQYDWKTPSGYGGLCYTLELKLKDQTERTAKFMFKKK